MQVENNRSACLDSIFPEWYFAWMHAKIFFGIEYEWIVARFGLRQFARCHSWCGRGKVNFFNRPAASVQSNEKNGAYPEYNPPHDQNLRSFYTLHLERTVRPLRRVHARAHAVCIAYKTHIPILFPLIPIDTLFQNQSVHIFLFPKRLHHRSKKNGQQSTLTNCLGKRWASGHSNPTSDMHFCDDNRDCIRKTSIDNP